MLWIDISLHIFSLSQSGNENGQISLPLILISSPLFPTFLLSIFVFHEVRSGYDLNGRMKSFFIVPQSKLDSLLPLGFCHHPSFHSQYILF